MIASGIVQKLNAQMNQEFYTSNLYLQLSQRWNSLHFGRTIFASSGAKYGDANDAHVRIHQTERRHAGVTGATRCGEFSTLEDLFEQTVSDYQKRISPLTLAWGRKGATETS
jgi:ferritin-like protein 2